MNKNELIDSMAAEAGMTKADTTKALDAFMRFEAAEKYKPHFTD